MSSTETPRSSSSWGTCARKLPQCSSEASGNKSTAHPGFGSDKATDSVSDKILSRLPGPDQPRVPVPGRDRPVRCHTFCATLGARQMLLQENTKRMNNLCHARQIRTQPINSLQELHKLARSLGPPQGYQARQPLRVVLDLPLRVHLPAPSDASLEKVTLVSRSVQSDLFQALQDELQRIEQVSLVQTPVYHIVHPNNAMQPLQHACKRRLKLGGGVGVYKPPGVVIIKISCACGASGHFQ